ncbi:hypothetical protein FJV76_24110 [Mesorhizobium sp. WSM4303]|nr:hypothetical protein FJV76_24110 [Mesorhizobium sp. WSM4303]
MHVVVPEPQYTSGRHALEQFTVSQKRRPALSLWLFAIPKGKRCALFPGNPLHPFPGIALSQSKQGNRRANTFRAAEGDPDVRSFRSKR